MSSVLPTWATVAIALGGSALGAVSGGLAAYLTLRSTRLGLGHQSHEAWRTRLIEAAQAFVDGYVKFAMAIGEATWERDPAKALGSAYAARQEAQTAGIRVSLLFGQGSDVDEAAESVLNALGESLKELRSGNQDTAEELWGQADEAQERFLTLAHAAIKRE